MVNHDIVVIGASAGGVQAVTQLAEGLPRGFPGTLFVVVHTSPLSPGVLDGIIRRACSLPVEYARHNQRFKRGCIYIAPADQHLLIEDGRMILTRGPKENGFRPAVDPLFRTAASHYGPRVVAVVLSGSLDDGTDGVALVKAGGGATIAQDPEEAIFPSMPASAIREVGVNRVLKVQEIPAVLMELANEGTPAAGHNQKSAPHKHPAPDVAASGDVGRRNGNLDAPPTAMTCPECGGAIWNFPTGDQLRFRCHVGHTYTAEGLMTAQVVELEAALWSAVRALEEMADMRKRMADRMKERRLSAVAVDYDKQAAEARDRADVIRELLMRDLHHGNAKGNGNGGHPKSPKKMTPRPARPVARGRSGKPLKRQPSTR